MVGLSVSVKNPKIGIGRSLVDIPIGSGSTEDAMNHGRLRTNISLEKVKTMSTI